MFAAMMRKLMYPAGRDAVACAGKGGNQGGEFMMERARQMLIAQGHDGDPSRIMMVGDRFDTDVRMHAHAAHAPCSRSGAAPRLSERRPTPPHASASPLMWRVRSRAPSTSETGTRTGSVSCGWGSAALHDPSPHHEPHGNTAAPALTDASFALGCARCALGSPQASSRAS
jgi:hypothetical protein